MAGETFVTLVLADQAPELAEAHDELYPVRVEEGIPLSLTLLAPFVPRDLLTDEHLGTARSFFAARPPLAFDLVHLDEFPGLVVYAVPEPEEELRATMRALWALFPDYPPYGRPGTDPPPHATLAQVGDDPAAVRDAVERRAGPLLPVRFVVGEATLFEEFEPDRCRVLQTFPFGG
ncbi:MAG TPA: 2'-5' RNA ligase family protein [Gaiellaceae bacterium]